MTDSTDMIDVDAWQTFFICVLLFQGLNNVAMCVLRYRLHMPNAGSLALKQLFVLRTSDLFLLFTVKFASNCSASLLSAWLPTW